MCVNNLSKVALDSAAAGIEKKLYYAHIIIDMYHRMLWRHRWRHWWRHYFAVFIERMKITGDSIWSRNNQLALGLGLGSALDLVWKYCDLCSERRRYFAHARPRR